MHTYSTILSNVKFNYMITFWIEWIKFKIYVKNLNINIHSYTIPDPTHGWNLNGEIWLINEENRHTDCNYNIMSVNSPACMPILTAVQINIDCRYWNPRQLQTDKNKYHTNTASIQSENKNTAPTNMCNVGREITIRPHSAVALCRLVTVARKLNWRGSVCVCVCVCVCVSVCACVSVCLCVLHL